MTLDCAHLALEAIRAVVYAEPAGALLAEGLVMGLRDDLQACVGGPRACGSAFFSVSNALGTSTLDSLAHSRQFRRLVANSGSVPCSRPNGAATLGVTLIVA
jgi:hypothetical protein